MGKLRQCLAIRRGEHAEVARLLVREAVESLAHDGDSDLWDALESCMESMTPQGVDALLEAARMEVELLDDANDVVDELMSAALTVSEEIHDDGNNERSVLFSLPLELVAGPLEANTLELTDDVDFEVIKLLFEHQVLDEACHVALLPMLLTADEADALRLGDAFALTRAMREEDFERAVRVVEQFRMYTRCPPPVRRLPSGPRDS